MIKLKILSLAPTIWCCKREGGKRSHIQTFLQSSTCRRRFCVTREIEPLAVEAGDRVFKAKVDPVLRVSLL